MANNILLENGTNELEILEFVVAGNSYGINVAKIREIITYQNVTPIPNSHPSVEGIFMPRDFMITAIDLSNCLQRGKSKPEGLFIITNFNKLNIAFHVEQVLGIHRVYWSDIIQPDNAVGSMEDGISTGIVNINGKLIIILDFEKIIADINPETSLKISDVDELESHERHNVPIMIVEDSPLLNKLIQDCLTKAGYTHITSCNNGQEALDIIDGYISEGSINEKLKLVITDIEMPVMDGHHLLKRLRDQSVTEHLPVIIFSSLVNEEMKRKGEALGANAQLSKPEIGNLIKTIDALV